MTLVEERADFCLVRTDDGLEGWAAAKYLEIDYPEAVAPQPGAADAFFVLTERVNFRSSPEIRDGNIIGKLEAGTLVRFLEDAGDFWKVETSDGRTGYCSRDYLRPTDRHSTSTPSIIELKEYANKILRFAQNDSTHL